MVTHTQSLSGHETSPPAQSKFALPFILIMAVGITLAYSLWGGVPTADKMPLFIAGIVVLFAVLGAVFVAGWHLLVRPLPKGRTVSQANALPAQGRLLLGVLITVAAFSNVIGSAWDDVWHHKYGVPFGEDFFWPPHILIYTFLGAISLVAFLGLLMLMRSGKGTLQQRFRANPIVGLLILVGAFQLFSVPADPIWHSLYGVEIGAWSVPHIVLLWSSLGSMFLAPLLILSTMPPRPWSSIFKLTAKDLLVLITFAFMSGLILILLTTEWDGIENLSAASVANLQSRPEWILTTTLVMFGTFFATMGIRTTRRVGAATFIGLVTLGIRVLLLSLLQYTVELTPFAALITRVICVGVDVSYALSFAIRKAPASWWMSGIGALVGMLVTLPFTGQWLVWPVYDARNLPGVLIVGLLAACFAAFAAQYLGDRIAVGSVQTAPEPEQRQERRIMTLLAPAAFALLIAVTIAWMVTAPPPNL
ncbi:MAG: hypothetical protein U0670_17425 [Anaerolineae bacterium]